MLFFVHALAQLSTQNERPSLAIVEPVVVRSRPNELPLVQSLGWRGHEVDTHIARGMPALLVLEVMLPTRSSGDHGF